MNGSLAHCVLPLPSGSNLHVDPLLRRFHHISKCENFMKSQETFDENLCCVIQCNNLSNHKKVQFHSHDRLIAGSSIVVLLIFHYATGKYCTIHEEHG